MAGGQGVALICLLAVTAVAACLPLAVAVIGDSGSAPTRRLLATPAAALLPSATVPCVDKPTPEGFTCEQQKGWSKCGEAWMLGGGFCRRTCNLCDLVPPATQATTSEGSASETPADVVESVGEVAPSTEGPADAQFCSQPPKVGPCRSAIRSWYFDGAASTCKPFLYGGCLGNDNRFVGFAECEAAAIRFCQGML